MKLVGASSQVLLLSGRPRRDRGPLRGVRAAGRRRRAARAAAASPATATRSRAVLPRPRPAELVEAGPYDPAAIPASSTRLRGGYGRDPVDVPAWGSGDPGPDDYALGPYARRAGPRAPGRRRRRDAVRGGQPHRVVPAPPLRLRRGAAVSRRACPTAAVSPADRPPLVDFLHVEPARLLPALRRRHGRDAALDGHPLARRGGLRHRPLRHGAVGVGRPRPRRPLVGRGLVPGPRLAAVRPDAGALGAQPGLGLVARLRAEPVRDRPRRHRGLRRRAAPRGPRAARGAGPGGGGGAGRRRVVRRRRRPAVAVGPPGARRAPRRDPGGARGPARAGAPARRRAGPRHRRRPRPRELAARARAGPRPPPARRASGRPTCATAPASTRRGSTGAPRRRATPGRRCRRGAGAAAWRESGRLRRAIRRRASLGRRVRAAFGHPSAGAVP